MTEILVVGATGHLSRQIIEFLRQHVTDDQIVALARDLDALSGTALAGIEVRRGDYLDQNGFIPVDETLKTTAADIWALVEVAGSPMFTNVSLDAYRVAKSSITGGMRTTAGRLVPYAVFIDREFARVGLNECDASKANISYRLASLPMDVVPRARTLGELTGFMKALVSAEDDQILGFAMSCAHAGEVMTVVRMAMLGKFPYTTLRDGILAHPRMAEGLEMLFSNLQPVDRVADTNASATTIAAD